MMSNEMRLKIYGIHKPQNTFDFDTILHLPISYYLSDQDIQYLHWICTDAKLVSKMEHGQLKKPMMIRDFLKQRGFVELSSGTNRITYRNIYDDSFVLKIGYDKVGMDANIQEWYTQNFLKPFCTKIFDVTPCGTVQLAERVNPFGNIEHFHLYFDLIYNLVYIILINYVMEDIGCNSFKNWGIREGFGPVLLDFPYVYILEDIKNLICNKIDKNGQRCDGEIGYDVGLNKLYCEKCNKLHTAKSIGKRFNLHLASDIIKGGNIMEKIKVFSVVNGKKYDVTPDNKVDTYIKPRKAIEFKQETGKRHERPLFQTVKDNIKKKIENKPVTGNRNKEYIKVITPDDTIKVAFEKAKEKIKIESVKEETIMEATVDIPGPTTDEECEVSQPDPITEEDNFEKEIKAEQKAIEEATNMPIKSSLLKDKYDEIIELIREESYNFCDKLVEKNPENEDFTLEDRNRMIDYIIPAVTAAYNMTIEDAKNIVREYIESDYVIIEEDNDKDKYETMAEELTGLYDTSPSIEKIKNRKMKDF